MKFQKRFYNSSFDFKELKVNKVVVGILLGLLSAFTIYSFFYVIRETYRAIALGQTWGFQNGEHILSQEDRNFYNLFFSGLSLILGNSIAIVYIFSRPNNVLNRLDSRRKRLLNDQIFLNFNFIYWLTEIGLGFGVFFMCCMEFEFLPYFRPIAYLLLIILYLEAWKNLARVIEKNRLRIQIFHFLVMLILTFGLSRVDVVNYKVIDEVSLENNPIIDFPKSLFHNEKKYSWRDRRIALKLKLNDKGELDVFTEDRSKIGLGDLEYFIRGESATYREELSPFLSVSILADKLLSIKYVKMVEAELYLAGIRKVNYEIYTENQNGGTYIENDIIKKTINKSVLEFKVITMKNDSIEKISLLPLPPFSPEPDYSLRDTIRVEIQKKLKIDGKSVSLEAISEEFKNKTNSKTLFLYQINESVTYQEYIDVLSVHNKAVSQLRKSEQTIQGDIFNPNMPYLKEQQRLMRKYPIKIIEKRNSF